MCTHREQYAETDVKAAPDVKTKLRYVARAMRGNKDAYGVVVMLATHGGEPRLCVCWILRVFSLRALRQGCAM